LGINTVYQLNKLPAISLLISGRYGIRVFRRNSQVASSQPFSKGEGLKEEKIYAFVFKVLSFGEDLGEA